VALTWTDDPADPQFEISMDAYSRLEDVTDARGRNFEIIKIHQPDTVYITDEESQGVDSVDGTYPRQAGDRMAASYVNFYIANGGVIAPIFNTPQDAPALEVLKRSFPQREVVGVLAREILLGGGNIHCITQQQPQG
jgi:agmatine deiminase